MTLFCLLGPPQGQPGSNQSGNRPLLVGWPAPPHCSHCRCSQRPTGDSRGEGRPFPGHWQKQGQAAGVGAARAVGGGICRVPPGGEAGMNHDQQSSGCQQAFRRPLGGDPGGLRRNRAPARSSPLRCSQAGLRLLPAARGARQERLGEALERDTRVLSQICHCPCPCGQMPRSLSLTFSSAAQRPLSLLLEMK